MNEDLRNWFREKWVRMDTKGNIKGDCAREEGEGKPKCLPLAKASGMSKEKRAAAARRKRREDPVADRPGKGGKPVNVATEEVSTSELIKKSHEKRGAPGTLKAKIKGPITLEKVRQQKNRPNATTLDKKQANFYINMHTEEYLEEKNKPTNPSLWSKAKSLAKQKFDVYPSAYANGWASKWYKSKGGGWKSVQEERPMKTLRDILESSNEDRPFEVVHKSGKIIGRYKTMRTARNAADKRDLEYGAIAHSVRRVKQDDQKTTSEGVVVMSDYKLDKRGHKYKAHRKTISPQIQNENFNPYVNEEGDYPHVGVGTSKDMQMARDIATMKAKTSLLRSIHGDNFQDKTMPDYEEDKLDLKPDQKGGYTATVRMRQKAAAVKEDINPYDIILSESYDKHVQGQFINDDDWYIVHDKSKKIVGSRGAKSLSAKQLQMKGGYGARSIKVDDDHTAYRGMSLRSALKEETIDETQKEVYINYRKIADQHNRDLKRVDLTAPQRQYAKMMRDRALKASKMGSKYDALRHYSGIGEEVQQIDEIALKPEHKAAIRRLRPSGAHSKTSFELDSGKQYHVTREGDKVHLVSHELGAGKSKKTTMSYKQFDEDVEQVDEISKKTAKSYLEKTVDPVYGIPKDKEKLSQRMKGILRAHQRVVGNKPTSEQVELDEASDYAIVSTHHFPDKSMAVKVRSKESGKEFHHVGSPTHLNNTLKSRYKINYRLVWDERSVKPAMAKEEVEQVDEISKAALGKYTRAAALDLSKRSFATGQKSGMASYSDNPEHMKWSITKDKDKEKASKRVAGITKASMRMAKEDVEQVDEISKATATSYVRKKLSQMGKRSGDTTPKDIENLSRAYKRMGVSDKAMREDIDYIEEATLQKVTTNPDGSRTASVKTDTGKIVNHTFRKASSINKLLKRRYNIQSSIAEN